MKGKILFVVGLGVGYVLGARAGRERYEQIRRAAEDVWNKPAVQDGVQTVKDFTMARVGDVGDTVLDNAKKLVRQVSGGDGSGSTGSGSRSSSSSSGSKSSGTSGSTSTKSGGTGSSGASSRSGGAKSGSSASKSSGSSGSSSSSS
ncbi:YtxH domain-containing protein [Agromyces sp. GXS1127]|uniref:YtxH domain-containing protein n=1 Tax=Agromyces sp. GXS1127 TaxID=3424181 RepID=UPI003D315DFC